jgi:hypothetical protein
MARVGLRFYRRVHLCPGLSVNLSRSGPSLTLGRNRITKTVSLPGTGIFYTSRHGTHTGYHSAKQDAPITPDLQAAADRHVERTLGLIVLTVLALVVFLLLHL